MPAESDAGIDIDSVAKRDVKEEHIDNQIIASSVFGIDISEVYSPERVNKRAGRHGLIPGSLLDFANGWDFAKYEHRRAVWKKIKTV